MESKFSPLLQHVINKLGGIEQIKRNLSYDRTKFLIELKEKEKRNKCSYK